MRNERRWGVWLWDWSLGVREKEMEGGVGWGERFVEGGGVVLGERLGDEGGGVGVLEVVEEVEVGCGVVVDGVDEGGVWVGEVGGEWGGVGGGGCGGGGCWG